MTNLGWCRCGPEAAERFPIEAGTEVAWRARDHRIAWSRPPGVGDDVVIGEFDLCHQPGSFRPMAIATVERLEQRADSHEVGLRVYDLILLDGSLVSPPRALAF